jgi:hypothetical protein
MTAEKVLPHFLRFARALTLGSGLAVSGSIAMGCNSTELTSSPDAVADTANDTGMDSHFPPPGVKPAPSDASDAQFPFPGVKVMSPDAGEDAQLPFPGVKVMRPDAQLPLPGVKVMPSEGGGSDPIPSGGPLAAPDFVA